MSRPRHQICDTLILFSVKVPVLSVQMREQEPSVSITSNFFTNTRWLPMRSATMNRQAVTVAGSPHGILAIIVTETRMG